jgi:S-adenosylmethionine uptake transporter
MRPRHVGLVGLRALMLAIDTVCAFTAFSLLPLADAYTLFFAGPMLVTALSVPLLNEHVGWRRWSAVIVGFCGVLIILRPGFAELTLGHLAALGATLTFSLSTIILRRLGESESSGALLVSTLLALVLVTAPALPFVYVAPDLTGWALMVGGGLLAGIAHIGLVKGFRMAAPAIVAPFQYTQMIWAVFYGYVLFSDLPEIWTVIGSLVIAASGLYLLWRETILGRAQPVPPAPTV